MAGLLEMSNRDVISGLQPAAVWTHFAELATIPRPSKHEPNAADYVLGVATRVGLRRSGTTPATWSFKSLRLAGGNMHQACASRVTPTWCA